MAQVDYFLELDGIAGESKDKTHAGEIELVSFSWGATNPATIGSSGGGGGAGKVTFQDIHITKNVDKSSPSLMLACATGRHIRDATITCRKSGGSQLEFLKIKLSDCLVSSYSVGSNPTDDGFSGLAGDGFTADGFSLAFAKFDMTYTAQSGETVEATFDQSTNSSG